MAGGGYCRTRLDRALATASWCERYPLAELFHLTASTSDHSPILLRFTLSERNVEGRKRLFRYEIMWEAHEALKPFVKESWQEGGKASNMEQIKDKLQVMADGLKEWDKCTFGSVRGRLKELQQRLTLLRAAPGRTGPNHEEIKISDQLAELHHREETMWRQRSRIQWLAEGDKNTRFFHQRASHRKKKNKISRLRRPDGVEVEDPEELSVLTRDFFHGLYGSEGTNGMDVILNTVPNKVTSQMNDELTKPYTDEEVKIGLFQMFPTKSPGPDGYPAHFFQLNWELCGPEVTTAVLRILSGDDSPEVINETFIVLIPKVASPTEPGQFRPISLCNVIYKIASKVLSNWLKNILPEIISQEQSPFVQGRLITDNIITA